jgi:hypothetical protein
VVPLQLLVASLVGWIQREQHDVIEYLREENRVLKAQLCNERVRLTDDDRRQGRAEEPFAGPGSVSNGRTLRFSHPLSTRKLISCTLPSRLGGANARKILRVEFVSAPDVAT